MIKISLFVILVVYYFNLYQSFSLFDNSIDDTTPTMSNPKLIDYNPDVPSDDHLSIMVTEYYKDLNTYIMPTEKIYPLEVFHDHDGASFSKTLYECIEYYDIHNQEIMKNTKHMKIIIVNTNHKSYCIMNTDLII